LNPVQNLLFIFTLQFLSAQAREAPKPGPTYQSELNVRYGEHDGQALYVDVFSPANDTSTTRPALLLVHGGGWVGGDRTQFHPFAHWYAERGYVVFSASYRLVKDGENTWPAQLDDVQLAVRWVRHNAAKYGIAPDRVAAMGGSAGGHLVAMLALRDIRTTRGVELADVSSRVDAVINWMGPSDLTTTLPILQGFDVDKLRDNLLGDSEEKVPEVAKDASPLHWVHANAPPMMVIHGKKDAIVPFEQSERLVEAMRKAGNEVEFLPLENDGHGISPHNLPNVLEKTHEFLQEHLAPQ